MVSRGILPAVLAMMAMMAVGVMWVDVECGEEWVELQQKTCHLTGETAAHPKGQVVVPPVKPQL